MIWLASYPRSGNTFFRIVLSEVYGIESSEFPLGPHKKLKEDYDYTAFQVVKTHVLPKQLEPKDPSIPAVYLVRDGRDSLISSAYHLMNIVEPGSEYYTNLRSAIRARGNAYWGGGWSNHVTTWLKRAALVIKFEDLITEPIEQVERLRQIMDLPEPQVDKLPTFNDLQNKRMNYGNLAARRSEEEQDDHRKKFFRKGKVGTWKEEMPEELHEMFWLLHWRGMEQMDYQEGKIEVPYLKSILTKALIELPFIGK